MRHSDVSNKQYQLELNPHITGRMTIDSYIFRLFDPQKEQFISDLKINPVSISYVRGSSGSGFIHGISGLNKMYRKVFDLQDKLATHYSLVKSTESKNLNFVKCKIQTFETTLAKINSWKLIEYAISRQTDCQGLNCLKPTCVVKLKKTIVKDRIKDEYGATVLDWVHKNQLTIKKPCALFVFDKTNTEIHGALEQIIHDREIDATVVMQPCQLSKKPKSIIQLFDRKDYHLLNLAIPDSLSEFKVVMIGEVLKRCTDVESSVGQTVDTLWS